MNKEYNYQGNSFAMSHQSILHLLVFQSMLVINAFGPMGEVYCGKINR